MTLPASMAGEGCRERSASRISPTTSGTRSSPLSLEAPVLGEDFDEDVGFAAGFAGRMALQAGIGEGDDPWPEADPMAAEMFGTPADELTPAQWREFGIRVYARNPLP